MNEIKVPTPANDGRQLSGAGAPVLTVRNLSKTFSTTRVLKDVDLELNDGESHALVGQNGSGKSTLIKILCGYHQPDKGAYAEVDGQEFRLGDSTSATAAGLRFVHQDLGLVPALGALDNLALGRGYHKGKAGTISWRQEAASARRTLARLGYDFDLSTPVSRLSASERTGIAIARALEDYTGEARVLVLDEPTASLPAAEVDRLFKVIRAVHDSGVAIIYVSHRFPEVFQISDRITILRDGERIATRNTAELDENGLIELTIGRSLKAFEEAHAVEHEMRNDSVLTVRGLSGNVVKNLDLDLHAGEILGVAGVTGSGREEIASLIFGAMPRGGEVHLYEQKVPPMRPDLSMRHGMALVPADRLAKAALPSMTLRENITIASLKGLYDFKGRKPKVERDEADKWLQNLDVVPPNPEANILTLSGGNQQKVILARALRLEPQVLILDEPTQGVDVGAKAAIHGIVQEAARAGSGVLVLSTESEELLALCDRIIVLTQGKVLRSFKASELTSEDLTELTMRADVHESAVPPTT